MASNLGIIGIKTVGGESFDLGIEGDKRVGFIVENASTFWMPMSCSSCEYGYSGMARSCMRM